MAVRLLSDARFYRTYPGTHDRFMAAGIPARTIDGTAAWGAGVHHAKGMIVDETRFFLGSQNWDWRALEHIHELGVVVDHPDLARDLARLYDLDWALAGGESLPPFGADAPAPEAPWDRASQLALPGGAVCDAVLASAKTGQWVDVVED